MKLVELGEDSGGWRDFLDGKPIHCGDQLQLWTGDRWVYARYEMCDRSLREVVLASDDQDRWLERDTMLFRWPPRE